MVIPPTKRAALLWHDENTVQGPHKIFAYTDGSYLNEGGKTSGSIGWIYYRKGKVVAQGCQAIAPVFSSFDTEMAALTHCLESLTAYERLQGTSLTCYTDSKSVIGMLRKLKEGRRKVNASIERLLKYIPKLFGRGVQQIILCWIPGHWGIKGNEEADCLAGSCLRLPPQLSYTPSKSVLMRFLHNISMEKREKFLRVFKVRQVPGLPDRNWFRNPDNLQKMRNIGDPWLRKWLFRLRSGHTALRAHWGRLSIKQISSCRRCGIEIETAEHVLLDCHAMPSTILEARKELRLMLSIHYPDLRFNDWILCIENAHIRPLIKILHELRSLDLHI